MVISRYTGYFAGATIARTGDEISAPALLLVGLAATGSAGTGSALLAGLTISAAFGGPVLGVLIDRSAFPGRVLAGALVAYAVGLALVLTLFGHAPLLVVVAVAMAAGLLNPAVAGGWTAQLPSVLNGRPLGRASALDAMTFSAASLTGPGLAGLVAALAGAPAALAVAIALVAAAIPAALLLPARPARPRRTRLRDGFRAITHNMALARATATSTVSYVGIGMALVCYPLLGTERLGSAGLGAVLMAGLAAASLTANAALARWTSPLTPDRTVLASTLVLGLSFLTTAFVPGGVALFAAAAVTGLGEGPQMTALFTIRHREAPEAVRAQVFTTAGSVKIAGLAVGAALAGPLTEVSVVTCLLAATATQLLAALTYLLTTHARVTTRVS